MLPTLKLFLSLLITIPALMLAAGNASASQPMGEETRDILENRKKDPIANNYRGIRVLVSYNATNYFVVEGQQKGLEYEKMTAFAKHLNKGLKADKKRHMIFISVPFERLIPALLDGEGDIIAAGMTITPERAEKVTFSVPYRSNISEIVVRSKNAAAIKNVEDLAGKQVHVVRGSSYEQHLKVLNKKLKDKGLKKVHIKEADKHLQSEDLLQMVNAGIYDYTVIDEPIADLWSGTLKNIVLQPQASINTGGNIAWAVRHDNSRLLAKINSFLGNYKQGTLHGNILLKRYYKDDKWITNPVSEQSMKKLHQYQKSFIKYGEEYDIDWILLTALGFQESKLNQKAASKHGAVGVMQIKPSTAADKNIGITGVKGSADKNIQAATKYLAFLRQRYFSDKAIPKFEQLAFTLAAYNAGPGRITSMRKKATQMGLDPNRWFNNVEHATRRHASKEPVNYVANIIKYYIAFKSSIEIEQARLNAAEKAQQKK